MFSSFFAKTKPINYFILSGLLLLLYSVSLYISSRGNWESRAWPLEILGFTALLLSIFIINEIVRTEKVTGFNSYAMLFFVLLCMAFLGTLTDKDVIFSNIFLTVATWRLLAMRSMRNVKHKIFDSTFLIGLASLFLDWTLVYLILVFLVINLFDGKTFKNWLVPAISLITLFILSFTILKLNDNLSFFEGHYQFSMAFLSRSSWVSLFALKPIVYLMFVGAIILFVFARSRKKGGGKLLPLRVVFMAFVLGAMLYVLKTNVSSVILITFFPASIFLANFLESIKRKRLQEIVLGFCIATPLLLFVLELIR